MFFSKVYTFLSFLHLREELLSSTNHSDRPFSYTHHLSLIIYRPQPRRLISRCLNHQTSHLCLGRDLCMSELDLSSPSLESCLQLDPDF